LTEKKGLGVLSVTFGWGERKGERVLLGSISKTVDGNSFRLIRIGKLVLRAEKTRNSEAAF